MGGRFVVVVAFIGALVGGAAIPAVGGVLSAAAVGATVVGADDDDDEEFALRCQAFPDDFAVVEDAAGAAAKGEGVVLATRLAACAAVWTPQADSHCEMTSACVKCSISSI